MGTERDSVWLLDEELGLPAEVPLAAVALEMTPLQVAMPTPSSGSSGKEGNRATESSYNEVRHERGCHYSSFFVCSLKKEVRDLQDFYVNNYFHNCCTHNKQ